ncbi:Na/Pi cotransporter family protein [Candidatus Xianfuyuplasma coldseepsis]|uniref:Na/Pi cotransporter family protein n=1 Tax=Candidatus Xianfuyuplasma coldseepsis TaxID=2782163 RepID=A0A7L7KSR9_9MOLU|nr:Na/Pi cotransporter family protein [Xianfuyuplasma coldseepsis]QMS84984.1 Na/Pi cotransporter family protein [Xianfuyuplasma coldseepsis]
MLLLINIKEMTLGSPEYITALIFMIFGGLGVFLYGINLMGDSLKAIAGNKLKLIIERSTNTPLKGMLIGFIITALIQSSSGTTAITVGLVRAGLMTLPQAIGIILGANIGTTMTSFLVTLNLKEYALPIIAVGSLLSFFGQRKKMKQLGGVLLGFGMLFYGLDVMGTALKTMKDFDVFKSVMASTGQWPLVGIVVGAVSTAIIQSSSATTAILQELYTTGTFELIGALAILLGNNIGTTVTAVLASIGGSITAKRTAMAHVLFNVIGSIFFLILLVPYSRLIGYIETTWYTPYSTGAIFWGHIIFNTVNAFIFLFLVKQLVWVVTKLVPGVEREVGFNPEDLLDSLIYEAPVFALENAKKVVSHMGAVTKDMLTDTIQYSFVDDHKLFEQGMAMEEMLDTIDKKTHDYLVKIAQVGLDQPSSQLQAEYVDTIRDFERIGDHCTNLLQFFEMRYEDKVVFSEDAEKELRKLYSVVSETMDYALEAFDTQDKAIAEKVLIREEIIDKLVIKNRKRHIMRINNNEDTETQDQLYVDILSNIERIGDHCNNIAINVIQDSYYNEELDYELDESLM